jgi:hypothetical protein
MTRVTAVVPLEQASSMYFGTKRRVYDRAYESLCLEKWSIKDSFIKAFTKKEKLVVVAGMDSYNKHVDPSTKDPRIIQPRSPRYNLMLAKYLKRNEHRLFDGINHLFDSGHGIPTVMKGLNARDQGAAVSAAWNRFKTPAGIRMDFSRFDQHVSLEALQFEHSFYVDMFHKRGLSNSHADMIELKALLKCQLHNRATFATQDGFFRYRTRGKRMSGDNNTGLGNVLLVCTMFYKYMSNLGIGIPDFHLVNNGDDCCLIVEEKHVKQVVKGLDKFFIAFGFEIEVEGVATILEQIRFCQCHPIEVTPGEYIMVRAIDAARAKDCTNLHSLIDQRAMFNKWRGDVAGCGLALCAGIPVMQEFYLALARGTTVTRNTTLSSGMDFLARGLQTRVSPITDTARISFFLAFGLDSAYQRALEAAYQTTTVGYYVPSQAIDGSHHGNLI